MSWTSVVKGVAPVLGGLLGGPLGSAALTTLAGVLLPEEEVQKAGGNMAKLEKMVERAVVSATPEQLAAMKQADQAFETRMAELGVDLERISQADRASARERQAKTGDSTPAVLAYLYTGGFFALVYVLVFHGASVQTGVKDLLLTLVGVFLGMLTGAKEYFFGSSAGSAAKNALLSRRAEAGGGGQ